MDHIYTMSKNAKTKVVTKTASSSKERQILGYTKDGIAIVRPPFAPSSFTVRDLQKAVRGLKRDNISSDAG